MSAAAIAAITALLQALPGLISAGIDVGAQIEAAIGILQSGADPTPAQWATLNAGLAQALANLMAQKPGQPIVSTSVSTSLSSVASVSSSLSAAG